MAQPAGISTLIELDHAFDESKGRPVVIFKHSDRCGVSAHAYQDYRDYVAEAAGVDVLFTMIPVRDARSVSDALADRTGIRHESPQVIVLRDGAAAWSASHWDISREALERALAEGTA